MSVKLYEMPHSPYCIPIAQMLRAANAEFERIDVPNWDRRSIIELTSGGSYQVPVLEHAGNVVFEPRGDSQEVARYVDRTFCHSRLFPVEQDGLQQILLDYLENDVEGDTFRLTDIHYVPAIPDLGERGMVIRHKERKFGVGCLDVWRRDSAELYKRCESHFARFDSMLLTRPFLLGQQPIFVDFLLYGIIGNFTFNDWNLLPQSLLRLHEWRDRMSSFRFEV